MLRLASILLALAAMLSAVGCAARAPAIPEGAALLYYGQGAELRLPYRPVPGQYWLYDETAGRVVSVMTLPSNAEVNALTFSNLDARHWYRLYLLDQLPQMDQ